MNDNTSFNPKRLKFSREMRSFTIKKLSEKIGVSSKIMSKYENGKLEPTKIEFLDSLSKALSFPVDFFYLDDVVSLEQTIVSFRSLARMSASVRNACLCSGRLALEFINWVEEKIELPPNDIPDLRGVDPETAAAKVRTGWAIGERPIKNLIHLLESKGAKIFSLNKATLDMDAYSFWINNNSFIFLNTLKSVERSRFDCAHELGHLVLHKHGTPAGKLAEIEANRFASAFLMPKGDVRCRANKFVSLSNIIELKKCWLVSASALIRRLKDLSIITEWNYNQLNIELSATGFRSKEPSPIPDREREKSKLIPMVLKLLKEDGFTKSRILNELCIHQKDLDELFFNLTFTGIQGDALGGSVGGRSNRPNLRIVS